MKIVVNNKNEKIPKELIEACNNDKIVAKVFYNRGIRNIKEYNEIVNADNYTPYNPSDFPRIKKACEIISNSIKAGEKIAVYGDYDVDGVTATSVLVLALKKFNADVIYHVPDRFSEGYGMNENVVRELAKNGVKTIITCDCGISNFDEIKLAKELGMKVVLTDHHTIGDDVPNADVVINYKMLNVENSARNISGCATAYYLVLALNDYLGKEADDYTDLVALSTISDVMPLRGESRFLFQKGCKKLIDGERLGVRALFKYMSSPVTNADDIGFQIAPRINAVGRMDTARTAVELFLTEDEKLADELALKINQFNTERKNIQNDIYEQAKEQVETKKLNKKILVLYGEDWHHGIIGIVAGKICEEYKKPCIILTTNDDGETLVGSARSTEHLNIYETLKRFSDDLVKFGGHSQAAGLSLKLKNLDKFTKEIENYADLYLEDDYEEKIYVDAMLPFESVNEELFENLKLGEPYGEAFSAPVFAMNNVVISKETINQGKHHFLVLKDEMKNEIGTTLWNYGSEKLEGKKCTIIFGIFKDTYKERNEIKIKVQEIFFDDIEIEDNKIKIIDRRNIPIENVIQEFKNSEIYYEGPIMYKPNLPTVNCNYDERVNSLILYSLPKSNKIFNRIVEDLHPEKIILNYSYLPKYDVDSFTKMFLGVIKNIVRNRNGIISIGKFAEIMQVEEEFINTFSRLLSDYGYFDFYNVDAIEIKYEIKKKSKKDNKFLEKMVIKYLREKEEYVNYMKNSIINK